MRPGVRATCPCAPVPFSLMTEALLTTPDLDEPRSTSFVLPTAPKRQGSMRRYWTLVRTLALTDFKQRYAGSALGYFWTVSKPLLLFGILYVVFKRRDWL